MAEGIIQYSKEIIDDLKITTNTTYSSDKIEKLLASIPNGNTTEVILGCFDSTNVPTTFVQDDQYYNTTDGKIYKAISSTVWDAGTTPKEDVLYASIDDNKIYAYIKNVWGVYGGNTTKISAKTNNIVTDLQGQTNANEDGLYVPLSKKSGNVIDNLTGQATDVNNGLFVGKSAKTDNALQKLTGNTNPSEDGLYVEDLNPKIQEVDIKTDKINIAQKTVNKVGTFPLLDDPIKFYGDNQTTPSTTDLDETVTLRDKVTNYDQLEILMKPSNPVNTHPQRTLVNTKDIVFNPKEYNIKDGSIINIRYGADTTTDVNTNLYDSYVTAWMKNDRTMYFRELVNGLSKNAFDDPKSPMVKFKDFTSNNPTGIVLKTDNFKEGTSSVYFPHEGANQIAITRPELVFSDDFTAQCWVYAYNDSDPYSIIFGDANNSQFMFFLRDGAIGDNMSLSMGTTRLLDTGKKATYNQWMHYVAERYNGVLSLYENGHIIGQVNYTGTCNMSNFAMGQNASAGNTKFHGYIDSLYVFDEAKYKSTDFDVNTDIKTDNPVFGCLFEPETALENSQEWTITEINGINKESVIIDPMNYIDTNQGIEDIPVGNIITKIGSKVPAHYLLCDGTEYNITDYPYLAQAIKDEFGTFNYYGGDGTTTFAVPNKPSGKFIKRLNPIMTSNTAPAGSILYSPSTAGKNLVYYAFKEQSYPGEGECWVCPGNSGYLGYEFVSHTTVNAYRLQPRLYMDSNTLISTPNSWDFQASNDLSTWDTLDSQTGITWSNTDEKKTFFFKNETPYKAYRIFVKINNGSNYVIIGNLQLGTTEVENSSFIKYEPTYFVGSINGYEQVEELLDTSKDYLFNGLNTTTVLNDLITLKDSIENYDKLEIVGQIIDINGRVGYIKNESVRVSGLTYNTSNSINECNDLVISTRSTNALFQSDLLFNFKDANTLRVIRIGLYSTATGNTSWQSFRIKSIRGIRHRYTVSSK